MELMRAPASDESGQAVAEYILLIAIVVTGVVTVMKGLDRIGLTGKLMRPISGEFAACYQFGHPKAKAGDSGGGEPENHPRWRGGTNNFRIFINPGPQ